MDINFELYKIFYHAAKSESFSDAAKKLYISQSAVSQAIKNLEEKTGVQLFFRKARNVKLTNEGEILFKYIEQAYNFIKLAETKLTEVTDMNSGEVRVGVSDTICRYFLIPYLEEFNSRFPKIKIQVINRTSLHIVDILKNGLVDFGIVTLPMYDKNVMIDKFITVEDIFVASYKFSEIKDIKLSPRTLSEYPLLMLPKNSATRQNIDNFLTKSNISITPEIELESMDLLVEFTKIGLGIAYVLKESAANAIDKNELFQIMMDKPLPSRELGIITMQNVPLSRASSEFIKFLHSRANN